MAEKKFRQPSSSEVQQHFAAVPAAQIERSRFNRSHGHKTTFDAGFVYPVYVDEVLPGDTFDMTSTAFARLATPLKPFMDNLYLDTHFFYVPYRFVWDNFEQFMGERRRANDNPEDYTIPTFDIDLANIDGLMALGGYMGLPLVKTGSPNLQSVSALPFRAYLLIWREWYRDQNMIDYFDIPTDDGPDPGLGYALLQRAKAHDYFTSCLPWPQAGDPVNIPLGVSAPVVPVSSTSQPTFKGSTSSGSSAMAWTVHETVPLVAQVLGTLTGNVQWATSGLLADLTDATAVSINDLRTAFQIQRLMERDARGGQRYVELVLSHFGVTSDDHRLGRPEYLGGGTTMVNINPVASTAPTTEAAQGTLAAYGTALGKGHFSKSFTEHGLVFGMISVRADLTYQQGIERFWTRSTRYDFYWPALAHLGEQAVYNREIYYDGTTPANNGLVFGYQERYAEYRYKPSRVSGLFFSEHPQSLDVWHLAEDFASLPLLNSTFIYSAPPIDRVIAVATEPHFILDMWFDLQCSRPMPVYSVPGMIDHF